MPSIVRLRRAFLSPRIRHLSLILAALVVCAAAALCVQHRYLALAVRDAAEDQIGLELTAEANRTLPALPERAGGQASRLTPAETPHRGAASGGGLLVADEQWRVVRHIPAEEGAGETPWAPGETLRWTPADTQPPRTDRPVRGRLAAKTGDWIAAAVPIGNGRGQLVAYRPAAALDARVAAYTKNFSAVAAVTLLWLVVLAGIAVHMILRRFHDAVDAERAEAAANMLRQTQTLVRTRDAVIFGLAKLAESRDNDTGDHLERISAYSVTLAAAARLEPPYRDAITPAFIRLIEISSILHDIGKVGIADRILHKRGALTPEERGRMQEHARIGGECLSETEQRLGSSNFLQMAREIALSHHERWDGTGYPSGLAGDAIPLAARIVAIADVYDALSSRRVYKEPLAHEECVEIIRRGAGRQFDPGLVRVWLGVEYKFREIAARYASAESAAANDAAGSGESRPHREQELLTLSAGNY